ncbi:MAG TPA: hypothetical protein VFH77_17410 [Streptomyces sp.]|nr:hypothetical protein [Streptomyces sp.]
MSNRLVIDCEDLWALGRRDDRTFRQVRLWLRLNGINPNDVPLASDLVIEDSAYGPVIRYTPFARDADGYRYVDPAHPGHPATEDRTALLRTPFPDEWLTRPTPEDRP